VKIVDAMLDCGCPDIHIVPVESPIVDNTIINSTNVILKNDRDNIECLKK